MTRGLCPLATITSTATLVGLFGTVFQIMTRTFPSIGGSRSTGIGFIAGRLSESMSFTAFGLLVSISAFWFYRYLSVRMETFDREMEHAAAELVSGLVVHFGPLRKPAVEPARPHCAVHFPVEASRFHTDRMFRHGVLQLVWPRLTSRFDTDFVLQSGMWISFAYGLLGRLNWYWNLRPAVGDIVLIFFVVAGLGVRAGSIVSILTLFAFLEFAFAASLVPFGWMFTSTCLVVSPLLFVGSFKAARFSPGNEKSRVSTVWAALRPIPTIVVVLSGLAACGAVTFGSLFPFPGAR